MITVSEARMYLQGEAERNLREVETNITLLSSMDAKETPKKKSMAVLRDLNNGLYQLARNLRREKTIPPAITANVEISYEDLKLLHNQIGKITYGLATAKMKATQELFLLNVKDVRKKFRTVESFLVRLEREGQGNSQRMSS